MTMFRIIAVLASGPEQPEGNRGQVLTLHVPLTTDAQLDASEIAAAGDRVTVELAKAERVLWSSHLSWINESWSIRPTGDDEGPLWRLDARVLRPGAYLTLYAENEREQGYRIVNVEPV